MPAVLVAFAVVLCGACAPVQQSRPSQAHACCQAGILRPSTFLLAPDAPPLMGTLDADDGGVAREVALLLLRLRHQRLLHPPPTSLSLRTPRRIRRHRQPRWAQRLAVGHGAAHRCGSPTAKGPSAPTFSVLGPGPGLGSSGVARPPAIGAPPSGRLPLLRPPWLLLCFLGLRSLPHPLLTAGCRFH